jgi:hypothetical protein
MSARIDIVTQAYWVGVIKNTFAGHLKADKYAELCAVLDQAKADLRAREAAFRFLIIVANETGVAECSHRAAARQILAFHDPFPKAKDEGHQP